MPSGGEHKRDERDKPNKRERPLIYTDVRAVCSLVAATKRVVVVASQADDGRRYESAPITFAPVCL